MTLRPALFEAFNIRPGEGQTIALLGGYSFLVGIFQAYYISLANASFLADFGVEYLPRGYLVTGVVGYLIGFGLSRLQGRLAFNRLLSITLVFPLVLVGLFRLSAWLVPGPWLTFLMFVCIGPFISLVYFVFRALIGRLFNLRQSKRLFGLISSGDVLSAIIGFFSVPLVIALLGDVIELLLVAGVALGLGWLLILRINREYADVLGAGPIAEEQRDTGSFIGLFRDRYLLLIVALSTTVVLGFYYVDYVFLAQVRERFSDLEFLARFISVLYGIIRVVELLVKTFLSGRLLNNYGLRFGLLALPALLCLTIAPAALLSLGLFEAAQIVFLLVVLTKLIERVGAKSFHDPSFNVLYQPLPGGQRLGVQTRVEGLVQPLAIGLAGGTLWLFSLFGSFAMVMVALTLIVVGWTAVTLALHRQYRVSLLDNLSQRVGDSAQAARPDSAKIVEQARNRADGDWRDWLERLLAAMRAARNGDTAPEEGVVTPLQSQHLQRGEERSVVKQRIEETVRTAAWSMASILDLQNTEGCGEVMRSLGKSIDAQRMNVFALLNQLYDPDQIQLVRESFASGDTDGRVYAMEQLDVLVDTDLKMLLFPLLEDLQLSQRLRNLDGLCPQQRLTAVDRLCDIVNSERILADRWLRACALRALPEVSEEEVLDEQVAQLFNRDPLLRETAAAGVRCSAPGRLEHYLQYLPPQLVESLVQTRECPLFDQVLLLRQTPLLGELPETALATLVDHSRFQRFAAGDTLLKEGAELDGVYLLAEGEVARQDSSGITRRTSLLDAWLWTPQARTVAPVSALADCRVFYIESAAFAAALNAWPGVAARAVNTEIAAI